MKKLLAGIFCIFAAASLFADSQSEIFYRTTKHLDKGGIFFQFSNTVSMRKQFEFFSNLNIHGNSKEHFQFGLEIISQVANVLELNALQGVGTSVKVLSEDVLGAFNSYQNKFFVGIDPQSSGSFFSLAKNSSGKFTAAANLPANTVFATGCRLNWSNFYNMLNKPENRDTMQSVSVMAELNTGVRFTDLLKNISGEYFFAVFKDKAPGSFHFLASMPDKNSTLKRIVQQRMPSMLRVYRDKSASLEFPLSQSRFGSSATVLFARNRVFIYNSNAPLKKLLNADRRELLLTNVNPEVFGFLNECYGQSYTVLNIDTVDFDPTVIRKQYHAGGVGTMTPEGYLHSGRSNFMLFDMSEYMPLVNVFKILSNDFRLDQPDSPL